MLKPTKLVSIASPISFTYYPLKSYTKHPDSISQCLQLNAPLTGVGRTVLPFGAAAIGPCRTVGRRPWCHWAVGSGVVGIVLCCRWVQCPYGRALSCDSGVGPGRWTRTHSVGACLLDALVSSTSYVGAGPQPQADRPGAHGSTGPQRGCSIQGVTV